LGVWEVGREGLGVWEKERRYLFRVPQSGTIESQTWDPITAAFSLRSRMTLLSFPRRRESRITHTG